MRAVIFAVLVLLTPSVLADGWYYPGDTWEADGTVYSVEGTDENSVLFGVGGQLYLIGLYDCKEEGNAEYCYTDTAYPDDEDHIKYEAGEKYYGYYITIAIYTPSINVARELSEDKPKLNEEVDVTVTFDNTGDYTVYNLLYEEVIPEGMVIVSGPKAGGKIRYDLNTLRFGTKEKFKYRLRPERFGEFSLEPNVSYEYDGQRYNESVGDIEIDVETPLDVDRFATETLNVDEVGSYELNLTNDDKTATLELDLTITVPSEVTTSNLDGFTQGKNGTLTKSMTLEPEEEETLSFDFTTTGTSGFTIDLSIDLSSTGFSTTQDYSDSVAVTTEGLTESITISPSRDAYYPGMELTISGILENTNEEVKFNTIRGDLSSDLFKTIPFNHESFPASKKLTEATTLITLPNVNESTDYTITFAGKYNTPAGRTFSFSDSETITVVPKTTSVAITRTIEPTTVKKGTTIKVTVNAKNTHGEYIVLDAHDKYHADLVKTSGLAFAEISLERDADQQLYIYELEIPVNFTENIVNLTTVIKVQDQPLPEEYSTAIELEGTDESQEPVEKAQIEVTDATEAKTAEKKKLGFFASIWDFVKGLFS